MQMRQPFRYCVPSMPKKVMPVMLPLGRLMLATRPLPPDRTGANTIGIVRVAVFAANAAAWRSYRKNVNADFLIYQIGSQSG